MHSAPLKRIATLLLDGFSVFIRRGIVRVTKGGRSATKRLPDHADEEHIDAALNDMEQRVREQLMNR